jgi:hypothetical protein
MDTVSVEQAFLEVNTLRSPLFSILQCSYTLCVSSGDRRVGQVAAAVRRPYPVQRMCAYTIYRVTDDIKIFAFSYGQNFF